MTKIGYKATNNYKCKNITYEIGQEYKLDQKPEICKSGFHYCTNAQNTLKYYDYNRILNFLKLKIFPTIQSQKMINLALIISKS